jgi:hypothetical protein
MEVIHEAMRRCLNYIPKSIERDNVICSQELLDGFKDPYYSLPYLQNKLPIYHPHMFSTPPRNSQANDTQPSAGSSRYPDIRNL